MNRGTMVSLATASALLSGCDWFDDGRVCELGAMSCRGDEVLICAQDESRAPGPKGPATKWATAATCEDDPVQGALTCAVLHGEARCMPESPDGGVLSDVPLEREWLRVDVSRENGAYEIEHTSPQTLDGAPLAASSGLVAAVAFDGDRAVDAALVPMGRDAGSAWVVARSTTRVVLISSSGERLAERQVTRNGGDAGGLGRADQALAAPLPSTIRVIDGLANVEVPMAFEGAAPYVITPSASLLELVGEAFARVPMLATSAITEIVFVSSVPDANEEMDAGVADEDGGSDAGVSPAPRGPTPRAVLEATRLWVDVSPERVELYGMSAERTALHLDLLRLTGQAFAWVSSLVTSGSSGRPTSPDAEEPKLPQDFPPDIKELLRARLLPMLDDREGFTQAWGGLHSLAVQSSLAEPYNSLRVTTNDTAVAAGFASLIGATSAELDFAEFFAYATLHEAWRFGPCAQLRGKALDALEPRLLTPVAKLQVLRAVGVLEHELMSACTGELPLSGEKQAIVLHKALGGTTSMTDGIQAVRTTYYHGEVHVSVTAQRDDDVGVVDMMYRDALPGVIRLKQTINSKEQLYGAMFAVAQPRAYSTSPSSAGLLVINQVTRQRVEAYALFAQVKPAVFGYSVFPLVTVRADDPIWTEDAP